MPNSQTKRKIKLSKISALHYFKLCFRSILFIAVLAIYIINRVVRPDSFIHTIKAHIHNTHIDPIVINFITLVFVVEMILRFFPSSLESMGCQKQFKKNFIPTGEPKPAKNLNHGVIVAAAAWILLNSVIGVLYFTDIIDSGMLILISLAYSVCDMICILFFCPFQTWFMKNKCCGSCRIYNWDFAMMFTPCLFIPNPYTLTLCGISILLLIYWEVMAWRHPERFSEQSNACLSCANCTEKLCHHKKQLRSFLKKNKDILITKGNSVVEKAKNRHAERQNTKNNK